MPEEKSIPKSPPPKPEKREEPPKKPGRLAEGMEVIPKKR